MKLRPPSLFGPVLYSDLVRSARRGRMTLLRCLYALAMLGMLFAFYCKWFLPQNGGSWLNPSIPPDEQARFAEAFFQALAVVQYVAAVLLTPVCTAGALADEKERTTLDFLLASDLSGAEIIMEKLASRVLYLLLLVLTGLPVFCLLPFLGGVSPAHVLGAFAVTAATVASLASLSILVSTLSRSTRAAVLVTYVVAGLYFVVTGSLSDGRPGDGPIDWLCAGNIRGVIHRLNDFATVPGATFSPLRQPGGAFVAYLPFLMFHASVTTLCLLAAAALLRWWNRRHNPNQPTESFSLLPQLAPRPPVGADAMRWKELHAERFVHVSRGGAHMIAAVTRVVVALTLLGMFCVYFASADLQSSVHSMNQIVRVLGTALGSLMLLGVALRAAGSVSGEREHTTMPSLLSTRLGEREILAAKWWGGLLSVRKAWWALAGLWIFAVSTGGLHPAAPLLLAVVWIIYAAFLSSLGLYLSLRCRNSMRASIAVIAILTALSAGPWAMAIGSRALGSSAAGDGWISQVAAASLSPPTVLYAFADEKQDFHTLVTLHWDRRALLRSGVALVFGLVLYLLAAETLWDAAVSRFSHTSGRGPFVQGTPPPDSFIVPGKTMAPS